MQTVKVSINMRVLYMCCACGCMLTGLLNARLGTAVSVIVYLFCFGTAAKDIRRGVGSIFRLKPQNNAVPSIVNLLTFTAIILSSVARNDEISRYLPLCMCSFSAVSHGSQESTVFESVYFSLSLILSAVSWAIGTVLSGNLTAGINAAYCCLLGAAVWKAYEKPPAEYITRSAA